MCSRGAIWRSTWNAGWSPACSCSATLATQTSYVNDQGETVPFSAAMLKKQAVVISELFKIEDGKIRRIEAVMTGGPGSRCAVRLG